MKKIIFRKLLLDCLIFFFLALIGISTIIWVFQAVNFLDIMIEDGGNYNIYFNYTLLNFPKIISRILPFALFFSFSYTFIKYENDNELIIFWNHGINKFKIVNFFFWVSILIMFVQILLLSIIVPKSQEIARSKLRSSNVDYFQGLIKPKKFNDTIKGLTIYAEDKNMNEEFKNIYIKKNNSVSGFQITFAKKGVFEFKGNKKILVLYDGQTITQKGKNVTNFDFSKSDFGSISYARFPYHICGSPSIKSQGAGCARGILLPRNRTYRLRHLRQAGGGRKNVGVWLWLLALEPWV